MNLGHPPLRANITSNFIKHKPWIFWCLCTFAWSLVNNYSKFYLPYRLQFSKPCLINYSAFVNEPCPFGNLICKTQIKEQALSVLYLNLRWNGSFANRRPTDGRTVMKSILLFFSLLEICNKPNLLLQTTSEQWKVVHNHSTSRKLCLRSFAHTYWNV